MKTTCSIYWPDGKQVVVIATLDAVDAVKSLSISGAAERLDDVVSRFQSAEAMAAELSWIATRDRAILHIEHDPSRAPFSETPANS